MKTLGKAINGQPFSPSPAVSCGKTAAFDVRQSFGAKLLEALASLASEDGVVSPAEYEAVLQAAEALDNSNVAAFLALSALEHPKRPSEALAQLRTAAEELQEPERLRLISIAWPLLELQGEKAQATAEQYAKALGVSLTRQQCESLQRGAESPIWRTVTVHSMRRIKGREVIANARESIRYTGDSRLSKAIAEYLNGVQDLKSIEVLTQESNQRLAQQLQVFASMISSLGADVEHRRALLDMAKELVSQIDQRKAIFSSRVDLEKYEFNDEFEDLIHDAGNAFELEVRDRMEGSNWGLAIFWDRIGRGPFARELERRIDRITRRYGERLRYLRQEAIHFQKEYQIASGRLLTRTHHSAFSKLMPGLRVSTQVYGSVDAVADVAVRGSVIAGIGTGVAMYFFGAAAVLPLVAPAAPFVGAALVIGALWKSLSDPKARGSEELSQKRTAFEQALRQQLEGNRTKLFSELELVRSDFIRSAEAIAAPTLAEAQAHVDLVALQERVLRRVVQSAQRFLVAG